MKEQCRGHVSDYLLLRTKNTKKNTILSIKSTICDIPTNPLCVLLLRNSSQTKNKMKIQNEENSVFSAETMLKRKKKRYCFEQSIKS